MPLAYIMWIDGSNAPVDPGYFPPGVGGPGSRPPSGGAHPSHPITRPDLTPSHPIYIPITPPPDSGLSPEHPIYIPVDPGFGNPDDPVYRPPVGGPPGYWGGGPHVENPIYRPGAADVKAAMMAKIVAAVRFWTGNLPPGPEQPPTPTPV
jgi:hypothetical protein